MPKKITILSTVAAFVAITVLVISCKKKKDVIVPQATPVGFSIPAGWPAIKYNLDSNKLTRQGIDLGRKLFYEGKLSKDGQFPCASCHQSIAAMATFDHNLSHGFNGQFTTRNAPSLANLAWQSAFHYDGGINHLDAQPMAHITAPNEMAETLENVLNKLRADAKYPAMFTAAFGDATINTQRMLKALSQFMLTMVSANSKYDKVKRGEATFTLPEQLGYDIFKAKCATCHPEPLFTDFKFRNNGLALDPNNKDFGRMGITNNKADSLKFKVPSLRNVNVTFPYMHDGRLYSLYDVLDHYSTNVISGPTTDPLVKNKIPLSNFEKGQLVAFMISLTDTAFNKDSRFTDPN